ncbi:MAG TPA: energy transducer TonB [Polyangia bacterium]|nr:energy transducer TonB [Polyangia bacterium]
MARARATTRLATSLLCAAVLHGAAFAVGAVVLSREPIARPAAPPPVDVDLVEVTAPRPDPVVEPASGPALAPARLVVPARPLPGRAAPARRASPATEAAAASLTAPIAPAAAPAAPGPSVPAPAAPPSPAASGAPRGGAGTAVSAKPRYRSNPKPEYPLSSRRRREEGTVLLNVVVQADGLPGAISLERSSGYPALDRAAQEQVRRTWTFEPARTADGIPVSGTVLVPLRFALSDLP